jgi:outer membrane protein assembly factor BamB
MTRFVTPEGVSRPVESPPRSHPPVGLSARLPRDRERRGIRAASVLGSLAVVAAGALAASCSGDSSRPRMFSTDWHDDQGKSIGQVQQRLRGARPTVNSDLVVSVAGQSDRLIGTSLATGARWTYQHALDARPIIAGGVVVGSGAGEIFALDAASGKKLWERPTGGLALLGAGDDGNFTAVTLARSPGSTLLVVGRDGSMKRQIETEKAIGDPAVIAGVVFVPWANQYVSAIDPTTGEEIGRVTLRDKVSRALSIGGTLYFGELAYIRFDENISKASRGQASRLAVATRELPGTPRLLVPGTEKLPATANARDRDRLFARPTDAQGVLAMDSGRFYASYFRIVFGFDSPSGKLAWVRTHGADLIGGEAIAGGVLLCDEQGKILVLDAKTGQLATEKSVGEPIRSCVVQADTWRAPPASAPTPVLGQQIHDALLSHEASLAAAQRLLLHELALLEDESATKTLVELASDPRTPPVLVADARSAISARRNGAVYMLSALGKHYDFLHDVLRSPPVGPMADALAAMKDSKAAPLLASHLLDPADTDEDVKHAAVALAALATEKETPQLKQFFAMYRGTAESEDVGLAVAGAGEALLRVAPKEGRALVEAAAKDPMTNPIAKARLDGLLALAAEKAEKKGEGGEKPAEKKDAEKKDAEKK